MAAGDGPRAPAKSSLALQDRLQRPAGLAGVMAQGGGEAGVAGQPQDGDGKVAQAGHDAWSVAGADLGAVLVVGDVADPVQAVLHLSSRLRRCDVIRGLVGEFGVDTGGPAADTVDVGAEF